MTLVPIIVNSQNIKRKLGDLFGFSNSYKGKIYYEPCFQLLKTNDLGQFEASQQVYIGEKEGQNRQSGIPIFTMLKTLDSCLYMKPNLAKNQLYQELDICHRV